MAGGEVTPDGLIAVGQIAKEYGLYKTHWWATCRYVWPQIHQLPEIWEKLIAAGFESGHAREIVAYSEVLRRQHGVATGVDDLVGFSYFPRKPLQGLRSPLN